MRHCTILPTATKVPDRKLADQFGVQRENYALMGFSSGGHIVGLIGSDNEKFGYKAFGLPQPAALLLGYPIQRFFEVKPLYQLAS
mgnify:CR=1 FL=1